MHCCAYLPFLLALAAMLAFFPHFAFFLYRPMHNIILKALDIIGHDMPITGAECFQFISAVPSGWGIFENAVVFKNICVNADRF